MQGNYGFDPLNLGADSDALEKFRQAEVYHCRSVFFCMSFLLFVSATTVFLLCTTAATAAL